MTLQEKLRDALQDIVEGRNVKRAKHDLVYNGKDVSELFVEVLYRCNFLPTTVNTVEIAPGERVPAFYLENQTAYFGWVFWEKFTQLRLRKLFGTVVRNTKGDWLIQITPTSSKIIYVNQLTVFEMDIDRPFEL
ncbi:MAG: hypothetical protein AB1600_02050 [Bacteroidota bacterium]